MELSEFTAQFRTDLEAAAALGGEKTQAVAKALGGAAETSARLMLLSALSKFAEEVSAELPDRTVAVRLDGTDAVVDVRSDPSEHTDDDPQQQTFEELTGDNK